jgi:predicted O-methyltransferase YrrM
VDAQLERLLEELAEHGRRHDAGKADRLERLRNLEPETARMLAVLVRALRPERMLELGTSNGYSTLWLADAARACGGAFVSVDNDPERTAMARANLERGGLADAVELRVEDGADTLAGSADEAWQLIFLDSERPAYVDYWPDLVRTLTPAGLLVIDNVLSHPEEVSELRSLISADERFAEALAPIGAGVLLAVKALR